MTSLPFPAASSAFPGIQQGGLPAPQAIPALALPEKSVEAKSTVSRRFSPSAQAKPAGGLRRFGRIKAQEG